MEPQPPTPPFTQQNVADFITATGNWGETISRRYQAVRLMMTPADDANYRANRADAVADITQALALNLNGADPAGAEAFTEDALLHFRQCQTIVAQYEQQPGGGGDGASPSITV